MDTNRIFLFALIQLLSLDIVRHGISLHPLPSRPPLDSSTADLCSPYQHYRDPLSLLRSGSLFRLSSSLSRKCSVVAFVLFLRVGFPLQFVAFWLIGWLDGCFVFRVRMWFFSSSSSSSSSIDHMNCVRAPHTHCAPTYKRCHMHTRLSSSRAVLVCVIPPAIHLSNHHS